MSSCTFVHSVRDVIFESHPNYVAVGVTPSVLFIGLFQLVNLWEIFKLQIHFRKFKWFMFFLAECEWFMLSAQPMEARNWYVRGAAAHGPNTWANILPAAAAALLYEDRLLCRSHPSLPLHFNQSLKKLFFFFSFLFRFEYVVSIRSHKERKSINLVIQV